MAHTRKQGGKELLWMLGIPTVIAAGIFYWFINDVDSQFAAKPAYVASTSNSTTQDLTPVSTQNIPASQPIAPVVAAPIEPTPTQTETASPETTATPAPVTEQTAETAPAQTTTATAPDPVAEQTVASETTPSAATEEAVITQNEANAVALPTVTTPEPPLTDTDTTASGELTAIEIADTNASPTTTTAAEQGVSGAAGPSDTSTETTPTVQTETAVDPASTEPTDTGWIYIGQFKNQQWLSSGFDIHNQMPKIGEKYTLTWGANIRAQPPAKRTIGGETPQLAENVGYLAIGKQVEVLNIRRSGNKGHIWVEIPR